MTPIVAFAHCVCGIKLPLLSSQLPASNTTWLFCGDLPPPVFSVLLSLCVIHPLISIVYLCPFGLSHSLLLDSTTAPPFFPSSENKPAPLSSSCTVRGKREEDGRVFFNKRGVGKEVKGWNNTSSQRKPKTKEGEMNWQIRHTSMTHFSWLLFNAWVIFELPLELIYKR